MKQHKVITQAVADVNKAVGDVQLARRELRERSVALVKQMLAESRSKDFADGYIIGVTAGMDSVTASIARNYFEDAWTEITTSQ